MTNQLAEPDDVTHEVQAVSPPRRSGTSAEPRSEGDFLQLSPASIQEFLPSVRPWVRLAGAGVIGGFLAGVALIAVWPYRVIVRAQGTARPSGETSLVHAPRDGRVREVRIQPNQPVERGDVLAVLDSADLRGNELRLEQARSALASQLESQRSENLAGLQAAELQVQNAQATYNLASTEYQRYRQLAGSGAASREQMEERAASLSIASTNLAKARREVEREQSRGTNALAVLEQQLAENQAEKAQLGRDLGRTVLRAPVSGVVLSVALRNPLQVVAAGQELARIAPAGTDLLMKVLVSSQDIANVEPGQRADLRVAGCPFPDFGTLGARVVSVSPDVHAVAAGPEPFASTPVSEPAGGGVGASEYVVVLRPDDTQLASRTRICALRPGMDIRADIITREETVLQFLLRKARLQVGL